MLHGLWCVHPRQTNNHFVIVHKRWILRYYLTFRMTCCVAQRWTNFKATSSQTSENTGSAPGHHTEASRWSHPCVHGCHCVRACVWSIMQRESSLQLRLSLTPACLNLSLSLSTSTSLPVLSAIKQIQRNLRWMLKKTNIWSSTHGFISLFFFDVFWRSGPSSSGSKLAGHEAHACSSRLRC